MASLFESTKYDISAAKAHFTKGTRTHLEVTFIDKDKQRHYAAKGLEILRKTYYGYIPVDTRKTFLQVRCKNVPIGNKNDITEALRESFESFGNIVSIKPMLIEGTPYVSDQWIITFETTEDQTSKINSHGSHMCGTTKSIQSGDQRSKFAIFVKKKVTLNENVNNTKNR